MFSYQLLDGHAGPLLFGDFSTLNLLQDVVNDVANRSPILQSGESFRADVFRALAYDARKAYEGNLHVKSSPDEVLYGAEMLWSVLLPQTRILRVALGYIDHGKQHQAITYALEYVIEEALKMDFDTDAQEIIDQWQRLSDVEILDRLEENVKEFEATTQEERKLTLIRQLAIPTWFGDALVS